MIAMLHDMLTGKVQSVHVLCLESMQKQLQFTLHLLLINFWLMYFYNPLFLAIFMAYRFSYMTHRFLTCDLGYAHLEKVKNLSVLSFSVGLLYDFLTVSCAFTSSILFLLILPLGSVSNIWKGIVKFLLAYIYNDTKSH